MGGLSLQLPSLKSSSSLYVFVFVFMPLDLAQLYTSWWSGKYQEPGTAPWVLPPDTTPKRAPKGVQSMDASPETLVKWPFEL